MDMSPLTEPQVRQISALVAARRLVEVDPDPARCETFLRLAEDTISDVVHVRLPQNRYNLAYDSAHAVGEAMLARHGLRTTNGQGRTRPWPGSLGSSSTDRRTTLMPGTTTECDAPATRCTTTPAR